MNSRIGYDLLPDLASLPMPPIVVVQLHVEEPDHSGYVRYVTTRYGNIVDGFSVSSEHLARAVEGYDINPSKIHVIPTGVDAEREFNPRMIRATDLVEPGRFNILFAGRLTAQKAPMLMVDAINEVVGSGHDVGVHVVGDGELEADVRRHVYERGLEAVFSFHAPAQDLAPWYAASDLLLMTSVFEGVPYVLYEAMAMELPVVAPALAGNVELMADAGGVLVPLEAGPRAYANAIESMIRDQARARTLASAGRSRVRDGLTVQDMGRRHGELYDDLLQAGRATQRESRVRRGEVRSDHEALPSVPIACGGRAPMTFSSRPSRGEPLVSVVVPCFNHGRFLPACIESILEQDYTNLEVIVVDDASTDAATIGVLEEVGARDNVTVLRQSVNRGPSAARNRAITESTGRYVLPVDADNILMQGAVRSLVEQLQGAGELVGYIYPNCQYFGTRDDYFEPPAFNLDLLLRGNYCDTCSLIDREIFDAGLMYPDSLDFGHEDWDFVLSLARHGIRGEPARQPTLLYRKHGFTRSDEVEHAGDSFHDEIPNRHPELYGGERSMGRFGRWWGPAAEIKAMNSPTLSILCTGQVDFASEHGRLLLERLLSQSCGDLELIVECPARPHGHAGMRVRRLPPGLCADDTDRLREGLRLARGGHVMVAGADLLVMLEEPGFVERLIRTFLASPKVEAIAFTDASPAAEYPYRLLEDHEISAPAHALVWRVEAHDSLPSPLLLAGETAPEAIARTMSVKRVEVQWRQARAFAAPMNAAGGLEQWVAIEDREAASDVHNREERARVLGIPPAVPAVHWGAVRRWLLEVTWMPPATDVLTRQRDQVGRRIIKLGRRTAPDYILEYDLGAIQRFSPPGTVRLVQDESGAILVRPRGSPRPHGDTEFGHLELAPLPLFEPVSRAVLPDGSETLVAGERDWLREEATRIEHLGYIEGFPNLPRIPPDARRDVHGTISLMRCIDWTARRHLYSVGSAGGAALVGNLGSLHLTAEPGSIPLFIDEHGRVITEPHGAGRPTPEPRELVRWALAPLTWRGFGHWRGRARSSARRTLEAAARLAGQQAGPRLADTPPPSTEHLVGYLYPDGGDGRVEIFAATHPINGDQLLTHHASEAGDMGYRGAVSLGFALCPSPAERASEMARVSIPWASRFGLEVRRV